MKLTLLAVFSLSLLFFNSANAETVTPYSNASNGFILLEAQGEVFVHRVGQERLQRLSANTELSPGDLLIVRKGGRATVRCPNGQNWSLPEGVSGVINGCQIRQTNDPRIPIPRTPLSENNPYIISPRQTALLGDRLVLRWNPVPGSSTYTVRVRDSKGLKWLTKVSGTKITYTEKLEAGETYSISITTETANGSDYESSIFWVLDEQTAKVVRDKIAAIDAQDLPPEVNALAKAHIYSSYRLFADAIEILQVSMVSGDGNTSVSEMLSALYEQVGLNGRLVLSHQSSVISH